MSTTVKNPPIALQKEDLTAFAEWLQKARKARGLTQERLAELSDVDQALISKYERCILPCPRKTVYALFLGLSEPSQDEAIGRNLLNAGLKAAGFAPQSEDDGRVQMSDYGITYAPGWEALSDEHRRLVGETAQATATAAASNMIRIMGGAFLDVDDDGKPLTDPDK